jgi:predicted NBD/HSP70 family sugar kinase
MDISIRPELVVVPNSATPAGRSIEKRRIRKHVVLNEIRCKGPLSRADISKNIGYNLPSVSNLVDELINDGLVVEEKARAIPRGRRPIPVQLNPAAASVLGIDMGRRSSIGMVLDLSGKIISRIERKTPTMKSAKAHANWAIKLAQMTIERCDGEIPPLCGVGVGLPGLVAAKLNGKNEPVQDHADTIEAAIQEELGVPAFVDNDARMMALGSFWFGAGRNYKSFAVINIGHGIGVGLVLNGSILTGKQGFAGELGYIPLGQKGIPGFLDHPDCLENIASGAGLLRRAKEEGLKVEDAAELSDLARDGNKKAIKIFNDFSQALGRAISTILNLFDPEAIILSGRVCRAEDLFYEKTREVVKVHTLGPIFESSKLQLSNLGIDLGPLGAGACVLHQIFYNNHIQVHEVI